MEPRASLGALSVILNVYSGVLPIVFLYDIRCWVCIEIPCDFTGGFASIQLSNYRSSLLRIESSILIAIAAYLNTKIVIINIRLT